MPFEYNRLFSIWILEQNATGTASQRSNSHFLLEDGQSGRLVNRAWVHDCVASTTLETPQLLIRRSPACGTKTVAASVSCNVCVTSFLVHRSPKPKGWLAVMLRRGRRSRGRVVGFAYMQPGHSPVQVLPAALCCKALLFSRRRFHRLQDVRRW